MLAYLFVTQRRKPVSILIYFLDIVSVFRRFIHEKLSHVFFTLKVCSYEFHEFIHSQIFFLKHALLYSRQGICYIGDSCYGDGRIPVICSSALQYFSFLYTASGKARACYRRRCPRMARNDPVKQIHEFIHEVILLFRISVHDLFYTCKISHIAGLQSYLLACKRISAVIQRNFKHFARVEVPCVGLKISDSWYAGFYTAADTPVSRFFQGKSQRQEIGDVGGVVKEGRVTSSLSCNG